MQFSGSHLSGAGGASPKPKIGGGVSVLSSGGGLIGGSSENPTIKTKNGGAAGGEKNKTFMRLHFDFKGLWAPLAAASEAAKTGTDQKEFCTLWLSLVATARTASLTEFSGNSIPEQHPATS